MIKCEQCMEYLSAYVDGELSKAEIEIIDEHIEKCDSCSDELSLLKAIASVCGDIAEELPENFEASLQKRLESAKKDIMVKKNNVFSIRLISQIAAGFILVITLGVFIRFGLAGSTKEQSNAIAPKTLQMADVNTTFAMSAKTSVASKNDHENQGETMDGIQDLQQRSVSVGEAKNVESAEIYSVAFTGESYGILERVEGRDTQVRIEIEDLTRAIESIMEIEEELDGYDSDIKSKLQEIMADFNENREEPIQMRLLYNNDETWHKFLSELQVVFPDMVVENIPAKEEKEHIQIILVNSR